MPIVSKPYGDFVNNVDVADANKVDAQINTLYNAMNGGLDVANVPTLGDVTTLATTAKSTAVAAINEINANYPINAMSRQALINGNFDVWQRGTGFTNPAAASYTADRMVIGFNTDGGTSPANIIHSRQPLTPGDIPNSYYFYRVNTDGAGSSYGVNSQYRISQKIENGTRYLCGASKKVTVSFWARSTISTKKIGINLFQTYGSGGSPTAAETINGTKFTLSNTWAKYTYTFTTNTIVGKTFGSNNDDYLQLVFTLQWGSSIAPIVGDSVAESFLGALNIDIAQVQVNAGDQALPFQPRSVAEELALCRRYFQKSYSYSDVPGANTTNGQAQRVSFNTYSFYDSILMLITPMRMNQMTFKFYTPTGNADNIRNVTDSTNLALTNSNAVNRSETSVEINAINTFLAQKVYAFHWTADAEL